MRATSNVSSTTAATVRLTPSRVTEPFSTIWPANSSGRRKDSRREPSDNSRTVNTSVTVSTWPWTTCPPNRPPAVSGRSRLTRPSGHRPPTVVRSSVSGTASTPNQSSAHSTMVRQQPFTAMDAPRVTSSSTVVASMTTRRPSSTLSTDRTTPSSSTIPVNMFPVLSCVSDPWEGWREPAGSGADRHDRR